MKFLKIDEKWSIRYDPKDNDSPKDWYRHELWNSLFSEDNAVVAMFYALMKAREETDEAWAQQQRSVKNGQFIYEKQKAAEEKLAALMMPVNEAEIDAALATHVTDKLTGVKWVDDRLTLALMVRSIWETRAAALTDPAPEFDWKKQAERAEAALASAMLPHVVGAIIMRGADEPTAAVEEATKTVRAIIEGAL